MKRLITFLNFLILVSSASYAQYGEIRGMVTDSASGEPLIGATVTYRLSGELKGVITDKNGSYVIKPLVPGGYDLESSYVTFKPQKINGISVSAGKITFMNFKMKPANDLPIVEIQWEPPMIDPEITASMVVIPAETIEQGIDRDVAGMVANTGGGIFQREEGGSLNVRGARENATVYVVDGVRMYGDFSLPKSAIAEVTAITGGIPAQFGDATGGIILITTKSYSGRRH